MDEVTFRADAMFSGIGGKTQSFVLPGRAYEWS